MLNVLELFQWDYLGHQVHTVVESPPKEVLKGPALLLVHGFGASTFHWRHNIPVLATDYEVHALDLLGFGQSDKPSDLNYGGDLWRDQLIDYVRHRIKRPTVLVGNSLGGFAVLAAGADLGNQCAGVVLLNAAGPFKEEQEKAPNWSESIRKNIGAILLKNPLVQRLLFENLRRPTTIRRTLNQVYLDKTNVDDELIDSIRKPSLDAGAFGVFKTVFDIPKGQPLDELFEKLQSNLLLIWGIRDPWINAQGRRSIFQKYVPLSTTEVVLEAGHCPHDEVPEKVNKAIQEWLRTL